MLLIWLLLLITYTTINIFVKYIFTYDYAFYKGFFISADDLYSMTIDPENKEYGMWYIMTFFETNTYYIYPPFDSQIVDEIFEVKSIYPATP